jgi:hypothetical protein
MSCGNEFSNFSSTETVGEFTTLTSVCTSKFDLTMVSSNIVATLLDKEVKTNSEQDESSSEGEAGEIVFLTQGGDLLVGKGIEEITKIR